MPSPIVSIAQMREWEKATWVAGQSETEVIRRVGKTVADFSLRLTRPKDRVLILAGKGHNGQDALCAREHLGERQIEVLEVSDPHADLVKLEALLSLRPALVVDGLFGIGINRPLSPPWIRFIERVNQARLQVLAVDVPSGLNADTGKPEGAAIQATVTLTVGAPKAGLLQESAWPFVGRLAVASDVGLVPCPLQSEMQWALAEDFAGYPPRRQAATHKGTYGHVAIFAGSTGYHGAAVLAARGAQRAQPGLVTLFTLETVYAIVASHLQAVMVSPLPLAGDISSCVPGPWTAILIGPGLAAAEVPENLKGLARDLWRTAPVPMVVDASALDWLPREPVRSDAVRVITPHPGEAARLLGVTTKQVQSDRVDALRSISKQFGDVWVVLKGHQTLIGKSTGEVFVNSSGNPYLAQGGAGDVLAGYVAGLLAQPALREDVSLAVRYAVWRHGTTADRLQESRPGWVVEDLVDAI
jgi:ADP-dependent NAD(P)H-hydrate dehydratase / NAD(P)H-hydrate epimerase